jgi:hypothetical protein
MTSNLYISVMNICCVECNFVCLFIKHQYYICTVFSIYCDLCLRLNGTIQFIYCIKIKKYIQKEEEGILSSTMFLK